MPEILPYHTPSPRTLLAWDGTAYRPIHIDAAGNVQIDVLASALPAGAATAANQVIINATAELIALIRNALQSVDTDRLIVRGEDQLFTLKGVLALLTSGNISGANGYLQTAVVPDDEYWIVTTVVARDTATGCTRIRMFNRHDAVDVQIHVQDKAFAVDENTIWGGHTYLDPGDRIRVTFVGGLVGDWCVVEITGFKMTLET